MEQINVYAYVVTYNKPDMLRKNLVHLISQEQDKNIKLHLHVVDSSDSELAIEQNLDVKSSIEKAIFNDPNTDLALLKLDQNRGGAYGFYTAVYDFMMNNPQNHKESDMIWLMDDDTIPEGQALMSLVNEWMTGEHSFLSSFVTFNEGNKTVPFYKNIPRDAKTNADLFDKLGKHEVYDTKFGTFTSMFTSRKMVKNAGLPQKEYFIWGDDTEFTERLIYSNDNLPGGLVCDSLVMHDTKENPKTVWSIVDMPDDLNRIKYNYYGYRNRVISSYRRGGLDSMYDTVKRQFIEISNGVEELLNRDDLEYRDDMIKQPVQGIIDGLEMRDDFKIEKPWED